MALPVSCGCGSILSDLSPSAVKRHDASVKHRVYLTDLFVAERFLPEDWTIPTPDFEPERVVESEIRDVAAIVKSNEAKLSHYEKALKWRRAHAADYANAPALILKYEQLILAQQERLAEAAIGLSELHVTLVTLANVRRDQITMFWNRVEQRVLPQVAGRSENSDLYIRSHGRGDFTVALASGKMLSYTNDDTGETTEYPETVFGYEARVSGPDAGYGTTFDERVVKPATVKWGSYGGQETVADARTMMHVYSAAVELAVLINTLLGLGVEGTDR